MPAVLSNLVFQGSRIRQLLKPLSNDEPQRKGDASGASGSGLSWRTASADTTLVKADANGGVANSNAIVITVPPHSAVDFDDGTSILLAQESGGQITITNGIGVTINVRSVFNKKTAGQYALATLVQHGIDNWILSGDLEVVP